MLPGKQFNGTLLYKKVHYKEVSVISTQSIVSKSSKRLKLWKLPFLAIMLHFLCFLFCSLVLTISSCDTVRVNAKGNKVCKNQQYATEF